MGGSDCRSCRVRATAGCWGAGFTLMEVLIALSILAVGILAVAKMQITSIQGNAVSAGITQAATAANDKIEELSGLEWSDDLLSESIAHAETEGAYTISWDVAEDEVIAGTKTVTLTVSWTERGRLKQFQIRKVIPRVI